jgi:hypothetical protein
LDALLNKKSVKEVQKSKEGEELLELLYKPTAKASAVASKVDFTSKLSRLATYSCRERGHA